MAESCDMSTAFLSWVEEHIFTRLLAAPGNSLTLEQMKEAMDYPVNRRVASLSCPHRYRKDTQGGKKAGDLCGEPCLTGLDRCRIHKRAAGGRTPPRGALPPRLDAVQTRLDALQTSIPVSVPAALEEERPEVSVPPPIPKAPRSGVAPIRRAVALSAPPKPQAKLAAKAPPILSEEEQEEID